jgi:hypothetical protein
MTEHVKEVGCLKVAIRSSGDQDDLVLVSRASSRKRGSRQTAPGPRKRPRVSNQSDSEGSDSIEDEELVPSELEPVNERISKEVAARRLHDAEARLERSREKYSELKSRRKLQLTQLKELKAEIKSVKTQTKHACIDYRNNYVRPAIQKQFAKGIRE